MWRVGNLSSSDIFGQNYSPNHSAAEVLDIRRKVDVGVVREQFFFGESAPFRWLGHHHCQTTMPSNHHGRRHLGHVVTGSAFRTSPALIFLFWIVATSALQFIHTDHTPASTEFRPVSFAMQDYTVRFPTSSLVLGKRALGNPVKPVNPKPGYELGKIMYMMLILSGDIELNPGPAASIYPCGLCDRKVGWDDRGVACDSCDIWYQCSCISMQSSEYSRLDSTTENWKCYRCDFTFPDHSLYYS